MTLSLRVEGFGISLGFAVSRVWGLGLAGLGFRV